MLEAIEKLLVLQDRDRRIQKARTEMEHVGPEKAMFEARLATALSDLDTAKTKARQLESDRKKLELDVEAKKQQIDKYSIQQFQTKKNEEYKALAHEIEQAKDAIKILDDQQLAVMEQIDIFQKEVVVATQRAAETKKLVEGQLADLAAKAENVRKELTELESGRDILAAAVEESVLLKYERLRRNKGGSAIVGVEHSACGGCHMRLPPQIVLACQGQHEIVTCPNCGRIVYFTHDMITQFKD